MREKYRKNTIRFLVIFLSVLVLIVIMIFSIACSGFEDIKSYLSYAVKENLEMKTGSTGLDNGKIDYNMEGKEIMLPQPKLESESSLEEALAKRRSIRSFSSKELSLDELSQLLWAAQGITKEDTGYRTSPSAGALYPLELFLLKSDGVYHYVPDGHKMLKISSEDLRLPLVQGVVFQEFVSEAPVNIIITAIYERTTAKYGNRGVRYVHIEAGHCCQNILLQATALGLGAVPVGAFDDSYIQKLLNLPSEYQPLYVIPVGYPKD